jgi:hypothetical protein
VTERPILFSGPMVQAILAGRKNQTRRIISSVTKIGKLTSVQSAQIVGYTVMGTDKRLLWHSFTSDEIAKRSPYGMPGDRLWVREAWRTGEKLDQYSPSRLLAMADKIGYTSGPPGPLWYEAGGQYRQWGDCDLLEFGSKGRLRSSLHMPRRASRINLEIVKIRVERLQNISWRDALAEGIDGPFVPGNDIDIDGNFYESGQKKAIDLYRSLWESINGPRSWELNPWVWVIEFGVGA